jgi:pimeloyl-ACP methyl ester carboxylesterase
VPLDYHRPHGRQITITISRIPAADPAHRLGVLVLSPGGPGLGGLEQPSDLAGPDQPPQLRQRYDLIGFDARGIRHSTPLTCSLPPQDRATRYPAPDGSIEPGPARVSRGALLRKRPARRRDA